MPESPTTEELLHVLRVYASDPDTPRSIFDVAHILVPAPQPVQEDTPEHEHMLKQLLRMLEIQTHAVKAGYLHESVSADGETSSRFSITTWGMRWMEINDPYVSGGDLDETVTIVRSPMPDLDDEDGVPLHLWAVQGGLYVEHVGLFMLLAMLHQQAGAAPDEVGEVSPDEFYDLASRPQEDPQLVQAAIEELEQRHMLIRRDGRWLFSQLASILFGAGHSEEEVRDRVGAAVAAWLRERVS